MRTPFSYLRNGWMDCAEIWYAVRDPLDKRNYREANQLGGLHSLWSGMHARAHVRIPLRISRTAGRIALKIGVWIGDHYAIHCTQDGGYLLKCTCNCTHILGHLTAPARSSHKRCTLVLCAFSSIPLVKTVYLGTSTQNYH